MQTANEGDFNLNVLNEEAANVLISDENKFECDVRQSMRGYSIDGVRYDKCLRY